MNNEEIAEKVRSMIAEELLIEIERVILDAVLLDLGFDDLDSIEMCMQCEDEFEISIPDAEQEAWTKVQDIINTVNKNVQSK